MVAGGRNQGQEVLNSTEILPLANLQSAVFEQGPDLPVEQVGSQMVEFDSSVVTVGGGSTTLYQLKLVAGPWIRMSQTLQVPRISHTAFLVPDKFTNCH